MQVIISLVIWAAVIQGFWLDISELETEIDQLVYKLYDLTAEEIKIIEESIA